MGTPPVDPMIGLRSVERSPPTRPAEVVVAVGVSTADDDGCTITSGSPPVEAGVFSTPGGVEVGCAIAEVGCTMVSGMLPVEGAGLLSTAEDDGCTITSGSPPVGAAAEL